MFEVCQRVCFKRDDLHYLRLHAAQPTSSAANWSKKSRSGNDGKTWAAAYIYFMKQTKQKLNRTHELFKKTFVRVKLFFISTTGIAFHLDSPAEHMRLITNRSTRALVYNCGCETLFTKSISTGRNFLFSLSLSPCRGRATAINRVHTGPRQCSKCDCCY